jgi:hypothetical protein
MGGNASAPKPLVDENPLVTRLAFDKPTDVVTLPKAKIEKFDLQTALGMRVTVEPGWEWARDVGEAQGKTLCPVRHVGIVEQGTLNVTMEDGTKMKYSAGDVYLIEPGHNAKNKREVNFVSFEFVSKIDTNAAGGGSTYAAEVASSETKLKRLDKASFAKPSVTKSMPKGEACVCMLGNNQAKSMRATLEPGWTWKTGARTLLPPEKQTLEACPARHVGYITKGKFAMIDAKTRKTTIVEPGMCYVCEPGHDAEVVGDETVEFIEFETVL